MNNSSAEILIPSKQEIINRLEQQDTLVKVKGMQDTLRDDLVLLEGKVSEIDDCNPIKTKKILWIPSIDKKASFEGLSEQDKEIVVCFKDALSRVNVRIHDIVSLIEQVALFENDLYKIFDEYQTDSNELKQVLHDIFQEKGLTEEEIYKLLDSSFIRARTLRDRINTVRSEQQEENSRINAHLNALEQKINKKADSSALSQYVQTDDSRLTDARPASDVPTWAKEKQKPSYTAKEVGALSKDTKISEIDGYFDEHKLLEDKQDVIADLATIRRGAARGATALQKLSDKADTSYVDQQLQDITEKVNQEIESLRTALQTSQKELNNARQGHIKLKRVLIATSICTGTISLGALIALLILVL